MDFVAHRAIWSFFLLANLVWISRSVKHPVLPTTGEVAKSLRDRKTLLLHALASLLIVINWLTFVWAVMNDHALDASLGYYICPLVVVLLSVLLLRERLSNLKWIAVGLAAFGVGFTTMSEGGLLWVPLTIAFSFGFYGVVKKKASLSALTGLTLETGFVLLPALVYLVWRFVTTQGNPLEFPWWTYVLLFGSGLATIAPLALYASAVKHLPLSTVGFLQYIGPTIQFLTGLFVFGELLDYTRLIGFAFVWFGVLLFLISMRNSMLAESKLNTMAQE